MKRMRAVLPHVCIVLSLMFLVFLVLDDYNPMMDFLTNPVSKALLATLCAASIAVSVLLILNLHGNTAETCTVKCSKLAR